MQAEVQHAGAVGVPGAGLPVSFLRAVAIVAGREVGACFDAAIAYVFAAVFLLLSSSLFMNAFFLDAVVDMSGYFRDLPYLLVLFAPAITMRTWAEERAHGTFELLMTLPLPPLALVVGKFVAAMLFYLVVLAGSLPIVVMLLWLGSPDLGRIFASYVGSALLGGLFLAFGMFVSGLTRDQIVAFALTTLGCAVLVLSGEPKVVEVLDGLAPAWQAGSWLHDAVSVLPHHEAFCRGLLTLGDVAYFSVLLVVFLVMNLLTLRLRES